MRIIQKLFSDLKYVGFGHVSSSLAAGTKGFQGFSPAGEKPLGSI